MSGLHSQTSWEIQSLFPMKEEVIIWRLCVVSKLGMACAALTSVRLQLSAPRRVCGGGGCEGVVREGCRSELGLSKKMVGLWETVSRHIRLFPMIGFTSCRLPHCCASPANGDRRRSLPQWVVSLYHHLVCQLYHQLSDGQLLCARFCKY